MTEFRWENPVKKRLREGKPVFGATITAAGVEVAVQAANLGFDFLGIEMEHSPITLETLRAGVGQRVYPAGIPVLPGAHGHAPQDRRSQRLSHPIEGIAMKTLIAFGLLSVVAAHAELRPASARNVVVYQEKGRFAGWPANHGIWSWGDEIVVGFERGYFRSSTRGHSIDYSKPAEHLLARSLDGGETWTIETPPGLQPPPGEKVAGVPTAAGGPKLRDCPGGIDFTHPDFIFTARMTDIHDGHSRFYYSLDRGKTWDGPFRLPDFGQPGTAARTDYLVNGKHDMTVLLTVAKSNRKEGRVICARTTDGGKTWARISFVTPEPEGDDYAIMPSSVRLGPGTILTAVRYRSHIDLFRSGDSGRTWSHAGTPVPANGGNPPSMLKLSDGRLVLTYGYRLEPYGLRARVSADDGKTWSDEIVLRSDGGSWDLGYPRTVQRADGKLVTVYYYNTGANTERFIGATVWDPGKAAGTN